MASRAEPVAAELNGRSQSPSHQCEETDDLPVQSKPTLQYGEDTDVTMSAKNRREKKRLKRQRQKEEWKARKRAKNAKILESGGSTSSKEPNLSERNIEETSYYFENGLRKVYPYPFKFNSHAKGRWLDRKLIDVLSSDFDAYDIDYYDEAIKTGKITVNGKPVKADYMVKNGDFIENLVHRHETPVTDQQIQVIADTEDLFVINKPASIPVHPCGKYRHNSIVYILAKEHNKRALRGVHRLDRLTSGILIFCKTQKKAEEIARLILRRQIEKEYLCRVIGEFPSETVTCDQPLEMLCKKVGFQKVSAKGKEAKTVFTRISFNGRSSVVKCKPLTGRTHQIRVHLQFLGHPIVNDHIYNTTAWGPSKGKGGDYGKSDEKLLEDLLNEHGPNNHIDRTTRIEGDPAKRPRPEGSTFDIDKMTVDERCPECKLCYTDPKPDDMLLYLHSFRYKGLDFEFETELPNWAKEDWKK